MSLNEEKEIFQEIVKVLPVADIPELVKEYIEYNPFDKERVMHDILEDIIVKIRRHFLTHHCVAFVPSLDESNYFIVNGTDIKIPAPLIEKVKKYLRDAEYRFSSYDMYKYSEKHGTTKYVKYEQFTLF